jgi:hypothetical protein
MTCVVREFDMRCNVFCFFESDYSFPKWWENLGPGQQNYISKNVSKVEDTLRKKWAEELRKDWRIIHSSKTMKELSEELKKELSVWITISNREAWRFLRCWFRTEKYKEYKVIFFPPDFVIF